MRGYRRFPWLAGVATALVAWHSVLLILPHTHHDRNIPQYAEACFAARPGSTVVHLHPAPELMPHHGCLACLVSSVHGKPPSRQGSTVPRSATSPVPVPVAFHRADGHRCLPPTRAPPSTF